MEIEFQVAALDFAAQHPELHHYTNFDGLRGIIESNTLWAAHFAHLNDASEVLLLKQPLIDALVPRALTSLQPMLSAGNRHTRRMIAGLGAPTQAVRNVTKAFVESMYGAAFKSNVVTPLAEPYLTSFCAHSGDQSYEVDNGLLSQWRAYGGLERYCIVFDTSELIKMLVREFDSHYWIYLRLAEVHYASQGEVIETLFPELVSSSAKHLTETFSGRKIEISPEAMVSFFSAAPRFKHQGFKEEQEVRVIAIPGKQSTVDLVRREHPEHVMGPLKEIRQRSVAPPEAPCPYVALFDGLGSKLPMKRVIVGPSRHQKENVARARRIVGAIPLRASATPFLG